MVDGFAPFLIFSGPPPNIHVAVALRHLMNFSGAKFQGRRGRIRSLSRRIHEACVEVGVELMSSMGSPIVAMRMNPDRMEEVVDRFYNGGILAKPAIYPVVRRGDELLRFTLSAAHSDEDVQRLIGLAKREHLGWGAL